MKVSLATSLHLDDSAMTMDHCPDDPIPLQSFIPTGLLCLKAYTEARGVPADIRVTDVNGVINGGRVPNDDDFFARLASVVTGPEDRLVGLMTAHGGLVGGDDRVASPSPGPSAMVPRDSRGQA